MHNVINNIISDTYLTNSFVIFSFLLALFNSCSFFVFAKLFKLNKKIAKYCLITFLLSIFFFYLHVLLLYLFPGPYPGINTNKQNTHEINIFLISGLMFFISICSLTYYTLKVKNYKCVLLTFGVCSIGLFFADFTWKIIMP